MENSLPKYKGNPGAFDIGLSESVGEKSKWCSPEFRLETTRFSQCAFDQLHFLLLGIIKLDTV